MLSMLKMDFTQLHSFLNEEFSNNPALDGELPSLITIPDFPIKDYKQENSLKSQLLFQLQPLKSAAHKYICEYIIESLDHKGYLTQEETDISRQLKVPLDLVRESIHIIKDFEPLGIGAKDLKECLLIQVTRLYPNDLITKYLVTHHLSLLLDNDLNTIVSKTAFSLNEVKQSLTLLKTLNPLPANGWNNDVDIHFIAPDLIVVDDGEELIVEIPDYGLGKLSINPLYKDPKINSNHKKLLQEDLSRANTILKGLENRYSTLYNIGDIMVKRQAEYLKHNKPLASLSLIDIANQLGIHESTVSRGINGKYILYDDNLIPLRGLLSRSISNGTSVDEIKQRLALVIQNENKKQPFSDPQLAEELKAFGLNISRRTVNKYRNELNIKSAQERKVT